MNEERAFDMEIVRRVLAGEFQRFFQNHRFVPSDPAYFNLLQNRFNQKVLRAHFTVVIGRYIEEETGQVLRLTADEKGTVLPFVSEILMTVLYYDNQILDGKGGVATPDKIGHNLMQGSLLLLELKKYIERRVRNLRLRKKLLALVDEVYAQVCIGQLLEQQSNRYENWKNDQRPNIKYPNSPMDEWVIAETMGIVEDAVAPMPEAKKAAFEQYLRRIYLTNAYFFVRMVDVLVDFAANERCRESMRRFAGLTGVMFQMVNDVCDFVPAEHNPGTQTKSCSDALADLKNRNLTLPLMIHLLCPSAGGLVLRYLESGLVGFSDNEGMGFYKELIRSGAIKLAQSIGRKTRDLSLKILNNDNNTYPMLTDMNSVADVNLYYRAIIDLKKGRKPKEWANQLDKLQTYVASTFDRDGDRPKTPP